MAKRLQVLLDEREWRELQKVAKAARMTVAEWVRQAIRARRAVTSVADVDKRLAAIRAAANHSFPTADIDEMNADIARGYGGGHHDSD